MRLAFAFVPGFANLLEDHDCPNDGEQEQNGLGGIVFNIHLLRLQFLQVMRMLPAWASIRAAAKDFIVNVCIAAAVDLTRCLVVAARAVTAASDDGKEHGNGDQASHGLKYSPEF